MRYRAIDDNGDMVMRNGNAYLDEAAAVQQAVVTRLRLLIYEWWEDTMDGVPYWQQIMGNRDIEEVLRIVRRRIQQTTDVITVLNMEHEWDNEKRSLTIRAVVQSVYGLLEIEQALTGEEGE